MLESLSPCRLQAFLPARNYSADPIALAPTTASGEHLREVEDVPDDLLAHLSPLGWEHVNLTGDYVWSRADQRTVNADGYRPLRTASEATLPAA